MIGGTGLQQMPDARLVQRHQIDTQYSESAVDINELQVQANRFFFLARHGANQQIPPHLINYRANLSALAQLGVTRIFAVTAVGGIAAKVETGDLVVPDQIIDYTWGRESTFFDGSSMGRRHIDFSYPYAGDLRTSLLSAASAVDRTVHDGGTYACTQGPRLETAAEVRRLQVEGADLVGMTGMPEAALARELNMEYAALSVVVNPAAGLAETELSEEEIEAECHRAIEDIGKLIACAIEIASDDG